MTFGLILAALGYADATDDKPRAIKLVLMAEVRRTKTKSSIASRSLAQDLTCGLILAALGHADASIASLSLAQDFYYFTLEEGFYQWNACPIGGQADGGDGDGCLHTGNGAHVSLIGAALAAPSMPLNFSSKTKAPLLLGRGWG